MNNKGFTLIEMTVVTAIFVLLITAGSGIFISSIKAQRQSLASQEVLDQTSYLMEYMSKALRMANKDLTGACTGTAKLNYSFQSGCLKFKNWQGTCQQFCLDGTRIKDENNNYLTSPSLTVSSFNIVLFGAEQPPTDNKQPRVTLFLEVLGKEGSHIETQTTISQRNPDIRQ